jgi:hypothetical protein
VAQNRIYTVSFLATAVSVQADLFEIRPADDKPVEIMGLFLGQSSDFGDAAAELLAYSVIRGFTTSGSGGATPTPSPLNRSDTAAGFSAETCNTTLATTGTTATLHADTFHVASGEKLWLPEGCEWEASQADTSIVVRLAAAPADALTMSGTLFVREQG